MGYLIRVIRGNTEGAIRQLNKLTQADGQLKLYRRRRYNETPGDARRADKQQSIRRIENKTLLSNLRVVFARKSRGF